MTTSPFFAQRVVTDDDLDRMWDEVIGMESRPVDRDLLDDLLAELDRRLAEVPR